MENKFDAQLRLNLNSWLHSCFKDWDSRQEALYHALGRDLASGTRIEDRQVDLAMIGGPDLLRYLWQKHKGSSDYSVRKAIVENRLCPSDILIVALRDSDWEVRRIAVGRPETPDGSCILAANREGNDAVLAALHARLGDKFPEKESLKPRGMAMAHSVVAKAQDIPAPELGKRDSELRKVSLRDNLYNGLSHEVLEGPDAAAKELEIARYLKGQGHPHPEDDGTLDEFMNGGEFQALYDEAVENNYSLMDLDCWIHLTKILGNIKFETAIGIAEVLDEKEGIAVLELPLPEDRKHFEDKLANAQERSYASAHSKNELGEPGLY